MIPSHLKPLVVKYYEGSSTNQENDVIKKWLSQSDEHKADFIAFRKEWIKLNKDLQKKIASAKIETWNKLDKIASEESSTSNNSIKRARFYKIISSVAAVSLLVLIGLNIFDSLKAPQYIELVLPKGEKGQLYLPDGTKVWLNSNSSIKISTHFNEKDRKVFLEGEAFFDVQPSPVQHKFIVQTGDVDVVVKGTTFDVAAYKDEADIRVILQYGAVDVFKGHTSELISSLVPNEKITINRKDLYSTVEKIDDLNLLVWTFEELVFDQEDAYSAFAKMENWYGVSIALENVPKDLKYRFKVKNETFREMLQLINVITPITYEIDGKEVKVRYK